MLLNPWEETFKSVSMVETKFRQQCHLSAEDPWIWAAPPISLEKCGYLTGQVTASQGQSRTSRFSFLMLSRREVSFLEPVPRMWLALIHLVIRRFALQLHGFFLLCWSLAGWQSCNRTMKRPHSNWDEDEAHLNKHTTLVEIAGISQMSNLVCAKKK